MFVIEFQQLYREFQQLYREVQLHQVNKVRSA